MEDDDDVLPPAVKYGPPIGKGKNIAASTSVAGLSKLPSPNQSPKKKKSKNSQLKSLTNRPSSSGTHQVGGEAKNTPAALMEI